MDEKQGEKHDVLSGAVARIHDDHKDILEGTPVTRDGIQVHPQPTGDTLDPLNWSSWRKHSILAIICFRYWLFTYITTTT